MGRHNFGDALMPFIVTEALMRNHDFHREWFLYSDILPAAMDRYGANPTSEFFRTNHSWDNATFDVIIGGGEVCGCDVKCAMSMINNPDPDGVAALSQSDLKRNEDVMRTDGFELLKSCSAYLLQKSYFKNPGVFITNTIGGGGSGCLNEYDFVSVRNRFRDMSGKTISPDSVVSVKRFFGDRILAQGADLVVDPMPLPAKYIAVQFRKGMRDSKMLADKLSKVALHHRLPVRFFRAGAAYTHDSMADYREVAAKMASNVDVGYVSDLNIWKICAVIGKAQLVIATSLHVRIVSFAFSVPRITIEASTKLMNNIPIFDGPVAAFSVARYQQLDQMAIAALDDDFRHARFKNTSHAEMQVDKYLQSVVEPMAKLLGPRARPGEGRQKSD